MEKRNKIIYWVATILFSFGMLASGIQQVMRTQAMVDILTKLGYPPYFMTILGIWKILGVTAILIPHPLVHITYAHSYTTNQFQVRLY